MADQIERRDKNTATRRINAAGRRRIRNLRYTGAERRGNTDRRNPFSEGMRDSDNRPAPFLRKSHPDKLLRTNMANPINRRNSLISTRRISERRKRNTVWSIAEDRRKNREIRNPGRRAHDDQIKKPKSLPSGPVPYEFLKAAEAEKPPSTAPDFLEAAAATFRERNALYGNNYQEFGQLLLALFPERRVPEIATPEDAQRLDLIIMCLGKLQRYAFNFPRGGHADSAHDLVVYAAMLEEFTR